VKRAVTLRGQGATHVGSVRDANEDALIVEPAHGLYAVFDGMGGAMAGDIASQKARDVVREYVLARRGQHDPGALIDAALNAASAAVHAEAQARRDRRGMGTTAVVGLVVGGDRLVIGHVGDSRAYLLRQGRLTQLTRDHTVVAELLAQNAIRPEEAEHHAYRSVLSRNLGGKPDCRVDLTEMALAPGDRVLLCSDGLYGFASTEAVQQLLGSNDAPEQIARDLVEAALRGGGGDNVTVVVLDAGAAAVPRTTQMLRSSGAVSWWARRDRFLAAARGAGLVQSPICSVLSPEEALAIVAGNFVEALFHDLEKATTVNIWTYAENVARGWLDRGGAWPALRQLLDILHHGCGIVVADLRGEDERLALLLEAAVIRELTVAEMAVGGVLGEHLRAVEGELVELHEEQQRRAEAARAAQAEPAAIVAPSPQKTFTEHPTMPLLRRDEPIEAAAPEVKAVLDAAVFAARRRERDPLVGDVLARLHRGAVEAANAATVAVDARELFGVRPVEERTVAPLFDAVDRARRALVVALRRATDFSPTAQAGAHRQITIASHRLASSIAFLVVEAAAPGAEKLRQAVEETAALRAEVGKHEARVAELERRFATVWDPLAGKIGEPELPGPPTEPVHAAWSPGVRRGKTPTKAGR
jgi:serine/threonine protein phosphatase PrpC